MDFFNNLDLLSVGLATAAIGFLAFVVYFNNRKSVTNQAFLFFACITVIWGWVNYSNYQIHEPAMAFWLTKLTIFFATWHAFGIFQFFYVYPNVDFVYSKLYKFLLLPLGFIASIITLSPFALVKVEKYLPDGRIEKITNGPGMGLFALAVFTFIIAAIVILVKKIIKSDLNQKIQLRLILVGTVLTFSLLIPFNFILPSLFGLPQFIPYGMVFILPFIGFSSYAIIRRGLMNTKVVGTELLAFGLSVVTFLEVTITQDIVTLVIAIVVFVLVSFFGILLIGSVRKEVKQREELEILSKKLEAANTRLQELDKQKTEFLSIASHQLRTPLSILKGYIELIKDGAYGKAGPKMVKTLDDMDESNERLIKLVDEFLDVSRIEQGRTKFVFNDHNFIELVNSVVTELTERGKQKDLTIKWKPEVKELTVNMDDEKIRHVVFNFVDNAIKYTEKGDIKVFVEEVEDGVEVKVQDRGLGFEKKDEVSFFTKFYRGENVKGTNVTGTGLGLFVCRKFVETHGGRVWAHSPGLGKGSEFGFWIPLTHVGEAVKETEVLNTV